MELVNRVLFAIQAECSRYLKEGVANPAAAIAPTYKWISDAMGSDQLNKLSAMPAPWCSLASAQTYA